VPISPRLPATTQRCRSRPMDADTHKGPRHDADVSLRSFLIDFGNAERLPHLCAVTAQDDADALTLVRDAYRPGGEVPKPVSVEMLPPAEIQERIGSLDFGVPVARGIWYPHINDP
jgi:hypothetical protein